jgi:serine/threonine-protein kinase
VLKRPFITAAGLGVLLAGAPARPALADASPADRAAAESLYNDSTKLAEAGRWAEACEKLEASNKLDPAIGTLMRLASCSEHLGKTASAWSWWTEALALARRSEDPRAKAIEKEAARLEPTLAKLLLQVAPGERTGLEIRRDGTLIASGAWGAPFPVDPGTIVIEAQQPGKKGWKTTVTVPPNRGVTTVQVPALEVDPAAQAAANVPASGGPAVGAPAPMPPPFVWTTQRRVGLALGGVGLAGVVAGGVLGGLAIGKYNASKAECVPGHPNVCPPAGLSDRATTNTLANASNGALIGGGAVLVAGVVVFLTGGPGAGAKAGTLRRIEAAPAVGPGTTGMWLRGGF